MEAANSNLAGLVWCYKEIADRMGISIQTAREYVCATCRKLHVSSRTEAVVKHLQNNKAGGQRYRLQTKWRKVDQRLQPMVIDQWAQWSNWLDSGWFFQH
ncbi:LuxR C-terminal-related transcriptional regulator [Pedosphaera parvula]|uniref:Response regulator receiver protein n=1 Tax=Pedosphaera parvula (strain Ellin514) TaxID=320771 RepID=B9XDM7_PEDPL|nr:LuxR C-terminal-related transcriptional regulator [Pedosphaera parvula]EEF62173.1 response regulator receiver protein [Pedosphaera parvula Ellin514]